MEKEKGKACLTLHQPWASLLVHGIKRIEGRSWPSPLRGRLWIHAASKVPEAETIKAMEQFYREVYAVDGVIDIEFPRHYPTSVLLGCVDVVGCLKLEELVSWEELSNGVRLEGQTDYCWLCESPQKLVIPLQMRGRQGVYNLQKSIFDGASRALRPVLGSVPPTKFPPLPEDVSISGGLQNGSVERSESSLGSSTPALEASIAGAKQAALQFRKPEQRINRNKSPGQSTTSSSSSSIGEGPEISWGKAGNLGDSSSSSRAERTMHMDSVRPTGGRILAQAMKSLHRQ